MRKTNVNELKVELERAKVVVFIFSLMITRFFLCYFHQSNNLDFLTILKREKPSDQMYEQND